LFNYFIISILIINAPILNIQFSGNNTISSKKLLREISAKKNTEFNELNLKYDIQKINKLYKELGFFNGEVTPNVKMETDGITITFSIQEGSRPKIKKIIVRGGEKEQLKKCFFIKQQQYFIREQINKTKRKLKDYYRDRGYPYVTVVSSVMPDSGLIIFDIDKGGRYYIGDIQVNGLTHCALGIVLREIELRKGELFSQTKLQNSQRRIYRLGFFGTVDVQLNKNSSDTLDLIFSVRELKSRLLNLGIGLTIPLSFLISLSIEELNIFNWGQSFLVRPSFRVNLKQEWDVLFEGRYVIPHLTPAKFTASILPFYQLEDKLDFFRITRGAELRISKIYSENIQFNIGNRYKFIKIEPKIILPDTFKGVTNSVKIEWLFDYRDEFFNPKKGIYLLPIVEYAGGILGGDNDFFRLGIEERVFVPIFSCIFAHRFRFGWLFPTDGIGVYEKYSLGGQYSLRGYPEKSIGPDSIGSEKYGEIMANLNLEERINLLKNFGVVLFADAGFVNNKLDLQRREFIKVSAGLGLRYYTPIGPLRGDLGFPLTTKGREIYVGLYHIF